MVKAISQFGNRGLGKTVKKSRILFYLHLLPFNFIYIYYPLFEPGTTWSLSKFLGSGFQEKICWFCDFCPSQNLSRFLMNSFSREKYILYILYNIIELHLFTYYRTPHVHIFSFSQGLYKSLHLSLGNLLNFNVFPHTSHLKTCLHNLLHLWDI